MLVMEVEGKIGGKRLILEPCIILEVTAFLLEPFFSMGDTDNVNYSDNLV